MEADALRLSVGAEALTVTGATARGQVVFFGVSREVDPDDVVNVVPRTEVRTDDDGDGTALARSTSATGSPRSGIWSPSSCRGDDRIQQEEIEMKSRTETRTLAILLFAGALASTGPAAAQHDHGGHAGHGGHAEHYAGVDRRGDKVMGFSHEKTTHHFLSEPQGGTIQVEVRNSADVEIRGQIRAHLAEVARQFAAGDFSMPKEIHDRVLPGVPEMIERKDAIAWRYEDLENGGRVVIRTSDPEAVAAIHAFLKAQIGDHRTGDPVR